MKDKVFVWATSSLLLLVLCSAQHQASTIRSTSKQLKFSEEQCRMWGFEPSQLSCETCELFKTKTDNDGIIMSQFYKECNVCCQPWRRNSLDAAADPEMYGQSTYERLIIKISNNDDSLHMMEGVPAHIAAQLGIMMGSGKTPVQELVNSDEFAQLVEEKGGPHVLWVEDADGPGPVMLLFNNGNQGFDEDEADEVIDLRGWAKDDVRDLIKYGLKSLS